MNSFSLLWEQAGAHFGTVPPFEVCTVAHCCVSIFWWSNICILFDDNWDEQYNKREMWNDRDVHKQKTHNSHPHHPQPPIIYKRTDDLGHAVSGHKFRSRWEQDKFLSESSWLKGLPPLWHGLSLNVIKMILFTPWAPFVVYSSGWCVCVC